MPVTRAEEEEEEEECAGCESPSRRAILPQGEVRGVNLWAASGVWGDRKERAWGGENLQQKKQGDMKEKLFGAQGHGRVVKGFQCQQSLGDSRTGSSAPARTA